MLDLEADVFDYISGKVTEEYPDTYFTTEYNPTPPSFPAVSIREADNREANRYRTAEGERASAVMFEVAVYSNKVGNKPLYRFYEAKQEQRPQLQRRHNRTYCHAL